MPMPGTRGPTLRSQWLGQLLHDARGAAGKTLRDAATYLAVDTSTISRYENGRVPAKPQDVVALLNLYEVDDLRRRDSFVALSREAWRRDWWDGYYDELLPKVLDYAWLEDRATGIRSFEVLAFSGLIQTREFAEAVIRAHELEKDDQYIQRAVEFRMERKRVLRKDSPPKLSYILDEALLHRPIGGPEIMSRQLHYLTELISAGTVEVRVLPNTIGAHCGVRGTFQLFDLPSPFPTVGYAETMAGSVYVESDGVDKFVQTYEHLRKAALAPDKSAKLIEKAAKEMT